MKMEIELKTPKTTITLQTEYGTVSVTVNKNDLTIHDLIDQLVKPVIIASGYHQELVDSCFCE
jgi:hypothetical protein